jgi:hypothetical protein
MEPWLEIALAIGAAAAVLIQSLGLVILKDVLARVTRLEDLLLARAQSK